MPPPLNKDTFAACLELFAMVRDVKVYEERLNALWEPFAAPGKVKDIERAHDQAIKKEAEAEARLQKAIGEADDLLRSAQERHDATISPLETREQQLSIQIKRHAEEVEETARETEREREKLREKARELAAREGEATKLMERAKELIRENEAVKARFDKALAG